MRLYSEHLLSNNNLKVVVLLLYIILSKSSYLLLYIIYYLFYYYFKSVKSMFDFIFKGSTVYTFLRVESKSDIIKGELQIFSDGWKDGWMENVAMK